MKRTIALPIMAAVLALSIAAGGCSLQPETPLPPVPTVETALNVQLGGEPDKLDPAFAVTPAEESYLLHLLEGLTTLSDTMEPVPGAAIRWERTDSEAGVITYTFRLDPEAKWSDGQAVKAEDFLYAWNRVLDPATKSPLAYRLYPIKGARAIHEEKAEKSTLGVKVIYEEDAGDAASAADGASASESSPADGASASASEGAETPKPSGQGVLEVTLEGECPDFLQRLSSGPYLPLRESVIKAKPTGWYYDAKKYLTNGPYVLDTWERDQNITMKKNEHYRAFDDVRAKTLNFVLMDDEAALAAAFGDGTLQLAAGLPLLDMEAMDKETARVDAQLGCYTLAFNTKNKPFDDAKVRRALSIAIDRKAIAQELRDGSIPAVGLVPEGARVDGEDLRKKSGKLLPDAANTEEAQKLLKEAGHEGGKDIPKIKFLINDEETHKRVAESIAKMWEPLGVTVEIEIHTWDTYMVMREDGKFDVTRAAMFSDSLYPSAFFDGWVGDSEQNFIGYSNPEYDALINESYGRAPVSSSEEGSSSDASSGSSSDASSAPPASSASSSSSTSDSSTSDSSSQALRPALDCLMDAEKLLVDTDAALAPLTWYASRYAVAPGMKGVVAYPTGAMYFGRASYQKPAESGK